jgi:NAD(P)-dependent dehydrogenase (short-subunit alcohol dehydrogenase family)
MTEKKGTNIKLKGKIALITGGAQGLGKAIALAMANEGANIVIGDIRATRSMQFRTLSRMSVPGHSRRFDRAPATSVLPR